MYLVMMEMLGPIQVATHMRGKSCTVDVFSLVLLSGLVFPRELGCMGQEGPLGQIQHRAVVLSLFFLLTLTGSSPT